MQIFKKETKVKQILIRFLLLFYISSSFLSATHIHKDLLIVHNDCKVCIIIKNLNSGDVPSFEILDFVVLLLEQIVLTPKELYSTVIDKGFFSHAPPLFS